MMASARLPSSVPSLRCLRRMSPVEYLWNSELLYETLGLRALARSGAPMRTMAC